MTIKGGWSCASSLCRGVAKLVKAPDFDSGMRGFESFLPCQMPNAQAGSAWYLYRTFHWWGLVRTKT